MASSKRKGAKFVRWYPGQVVAADSTHVTIAIAQPSRRPEQRRAFLREVPAAQWATLADWSSAEEAEGYIELAEYAEGEEVVFQVPDQDPPDEPLPEPHPLRYILSEPSESPVG